MWTLIKKTRKTGRHWRKETRRMKNTQFVRNDTWSRLGSRVIDNNVVYSGLPVATITMSRGCWISSWQPCQCRYRADPRSAGPNPDARCRWRPWCSAFCSARLARENFPSLRVTNSWHALAATRASLQQKSPERSANRWSRIDRTWRRWITLRLRAWGISA